MAYRNDEDLLARDEIEELDELTAGLENIDSIVQKQMADVQRLDQRLST